MADDRSKTAGHDDLECPFIFVRHGDPSPTEWLAQHPEWIRIPATMVPRGLAAPAPSRDAPKVSVGIAGSAAVEAAVPDILVGFAAPTLALIARAAPWLEFLSLVIPNNNTPRELDEVPLELRLEQQERERLLPKTVLTVTPPPPTPAVPGLVPPSEGSQRPGEGGFTPIPPIPALPGFDQTAPQPTKLPGRPADETAPVVLNADRNGGLIGGQRTNSPRARRAARAADPATAQALSNADWQAHHLINIAGIKAAADLIAAAVKAGWTTDDAGNLAPLPSSPEAQEKLKAAGIDRPVHNGGHQEWNSDVEAELNKISEDLSKRDLAEGSEAFERAAKDALEKLQVKLRDKLLQFDKLTETDQNSAIEFA